MRKLLPSAIFDAVAGHLRRHAGGAHRDWPVNQANEDSLNGVVFAKLHTRRTRRINVDGHEWRWRMRTRKFTSGGLNSEEKQTGADGIIEVEIWHEATGRVESKGLLVQAKKAWSGRNKKLFEQVGDMERLAPGSSAAFDYQATGYRGVDGRSVLVADGDRKRLAESEDLPLGEFLADRFLVCKVGLRGLHYDARRQLLHLPPASERPEAVSLVIPLRLRIEIEEVGG